MEFLQYVNVTEFVVTEATLKIKSMIICQLSKFVVVYQESANWHFLAYLAVEIMTMMTYTYSV